MTVDEIETFDSFYRKDQLSFGENPTREIADFVTSTKARGFALDIGSGDGRNALFLARSGFNVTAIDFSKVGSEKIAKYAKQQGLANKIRIICIDARQWVYPQNTFDLIIAVTLFDHLQPPDIMPLFDKVCKSLKKDGAIFLKVHTIEDPGFNKTDQPASELAPMIHHYFDHDELLRMVNDDFRVVLYEEKTEEDRTHGQPHTHGFAQVLAYKSGC
jgi:cyclopropane fatty-acyl-phospholipid synthase-like methyltransferase